jgi:hypothetical protein
MLHRSGGGLVPRASQVTYLAPGAAYQLVAACPGGLLLWDCRAASKAVAEISISSTAGSLLLQPMPCGELLLTAAADGQVGHPHVCTALHHATSKVNG